MSQATTILDLRDQVLRAEIWGDSEDPLAGRKALRARADTRRFDLAKPPPAPVPRFFINGKAVCTPGNLSNIIAQAKAGKTSVISAAIAAVIVAEFGLTDRDCLGITATPPGGFVVLHFDTEQSPHDHFELLRRTLNRAGIAEQPPWLFSYGLAGFSAKELRQFLAICLEDFAAEGRRVFAVIIDGSADMVSDVNDAEECNAFVAELHALAIKFDAPIINVVHENPGDSKASTGKMRGHLGSQLERKAESNLRLRKTEEITVIFSEKMRRAPILEADGPRFKWSDAAGMHVSCESAGDARRLAETEDLRDLAAEIFADGGTMGWQDLVEAIRHARNIKSDTTAGKRIKQMKALGLVRHVGRGQWMKAL